MGSQRVGHDWAIFTFHSKKKKNKTSRAVAIVNKREKIWDVSSDVSEASI